MNKLLAFSLLIFMGTTAAMAAKPDNGGGISAEDLKQYHDQYMEFPAQKALHNAIASNDINDLVKNPDLRGPVNMEFTHRVFSKGITNQRSSGRCWLFTGLNVLRSQMMADHELPQLELSQNYNFFYDQLEKSNLFLQGIIDTANLPDEDRKVDWLFRNCINDGGQYTGVADNILKYGVVPIEVMPETNSSKSTSQMRQILSWKLKENGLELRKMKKEGKSAKQMDARKKEMLSEIYRILALNLGEPPTEFTWVRRDEQRAPVDTLTYTPQSFYQKYAGNDLKNDYFMVMNDPIRPYYQLYEIDFDRHNYDGYNWTYANLPIEDIKEMAIESLKDGKMMYFSCDVGKCCDRQRGILDTDLYDYESLFGTTLGMNKAERIQTHASGSTHAMTLVAVNIAEDGKPDRWLVENSWGDTGQNGHMAMTDKWFDEYMFRLVLNKKYLTPKVEEVLKQTPILLPPWDPMFEDEE